MLDEITERDLTVSSSSIKSIIHSSNDIIKKAEKLDEKLKSSAQYSLEEAGRREIVGMIDDIIFINNELMALKEDLFVLKNPVIPNTCNGKYRRLCDKVVDIYSGEHGLVVKTMKAVHHCYKNGTVVPSTIDASFLNMAKNIHYDIYNMKLDCLTFHVVPEDYDRNVPDADNIDTKSIPDTVCHQIRMNDTGENIHYHMFCFRTNELPEGTYYVFLPQNKLADFRENRIFSTTKEIMESCEAIDEEWIEIGSFFAKNIYQN